MLGSNNLDKEAADKFPVSDAPLSAKMLADCGLVIFWVML
jgi:hypothetical protein